MEILERHPSPSSKLTEAYNAIKQPQSSLDILIWVKLGVWVCKETKKVTQQLYDCLPIFLYQQEADGVNKEWIKLEVTPFWSDLPNGA